MKILKGEHLFDKNGLHICDSRGVAIKAEEDTECEILPEHQERVLKILVEERLLKGLNPDGSEVTKEASVSEEVVN